MPRHIGDQSEEVSVGWTTVWDDMSFGWPSDGDEPICCGIISGLGSMKTKYCKKKRNM